MAQEKHILWCGLHVKTGLLILMCLDAIALTFLMFYDFTLGSAVLIVIRFIGMIAQISAFILAVIALIKHLPKFLTDFQALTLVRILLQAVVLALRIYQKLHNVHKTSSTDSNNNRNSTLLNLTSTTVVPTAMTNFTLLITTSTESVNNDASKTVASYILVFFYVAWFLAGVTYLLLMIYVAGRVKKYITDRSPDGLCGSEPKPIEPPGQEHRPPFSID